MCLRKAELGVRRSGERESCQGDVLETLRLKADAVTVRDAGTQTGPFLQSSVNLPQEGDDFLAENGGRSLDVLISFSF